jgi:hypothetical protein
MWRLAQAQNSIRLSALVKSKTFPQRIFAPRTPSMLLVVICGAKILQHPDIAPAFYSQGMDNPCSYTCLLPDGDSQ